MASHVVTHAAGNFGSPTQLLILLAIVLLFFGGKRLRNLGGDIGSAIKGFKNSVADKDTEEKRDEVKPYQLSNNHAPVTSSSNESEKNTINRAN